MAPVGIHVTSRVVYFFFALFTYLPFPLSGFFTSSASDDKTPFDDLNDEATISSAVQEEIQVTVIHFI